MNITIDIAKLHRICTFLPLTIKYSFADLFAFSSGNPHNNKITIQQWRSFRRLRLFLYFLRKYRTTGGWYAFLIQRNMQVLQHSTCVKNKKLPVSFKNPLSEVLLTYTVDSNLKLFNSYSAVTNLISHYQIECSGINSALKWHQIYESLLCLHLKLFSPKQKIKLYPVETSEQVVNCRSSKPVINGFLMQDTKQDKMHKNSIKMFANMPKTLHCIIDYTKADFVMVFNSPV